MNTNIDTVGNSIENSIAGKYQIHIGKIFKEAWRKTKGSKGTFWGAIAIYCALPVLIVVIQHALGLPNKDPLYTGITDILLYLIPPVLMVGIMLIGIRRASDQTIKTRLIFTGFRSGRLYINLILGLLLQILVIIMVILINYMIPTHSAGIPSQTSDVAANIVSSMPAILKLLVAIIYIISNLFMLYFCIACLLLLPLIIERRLGAWRAMLTSVRVISKHWFKVFAFMMCMGILFFISACTVIGLIWAIPMLYISFGIMYREIVGIEIKSIEDYTKRPSL